jgi:hypothetical protein
MKFDTFNLSPLMLDARQTGGRIERTLRKVACIKPLFGVGRMESNSTPIHLYGSDPALLNTRRLVLEVRGFRVLTPSHLSVPASIPEETRVQLLLLCHSVAAEEGQGAMVLAQSRRPGISRVVLSGNLLKPRAGYGAPGELAFSGPLHLIAAEEDPGPRSRAFRVAANRSIPALRRTQCHSIKARFVGSIT